MSSSQTNQASKASGKFNRLGNLGTRLLDRALLDVVRDTENPNSVVRYHSLLRDLYGGQGFQGVVYSPRYDGLALDRYSGPSNSLCWRRQIGTPAQQTRADQGQFIDIYVRALAWNPTTNASFDDPLNSIDRLILPLSNESHGPTKLLQPDMRHIVKIDRNVFGQAETLHDAADQGLFQRLPADDYERRSGRANGADRRIRLPGRYRSINPEQGLIALRTENPPARQRGCSASA